jgi:hypothetical protein
MTSSQSAFLSDTRRRLILWSRAVVRSGPARAVRSLVPSGVRRIFHRVVQRIDSEPMRLVVPAAGTSADPVRVVILGSFANDWIPRLASLETWLGIPDVREVLLYPVPEDLGAHPVPEDGMRIVVIPLSEIDGVTLPQTARMLVPTAEAVDTLHDKLRFARHAEACGLAAVVPRVYETVDRVEFPCILKPTKDAFGQGTLLVRSREELEARFPGGHWDPSAWICQRVVVGDTEYAMHCIVDRGRVVWHCSFAFQMADPDGIRRGIAYRSMEACDSPASVIEAVNGLLKPLDYSGPCCVDYKFTAGDRFVVFEINPRFGGTLMLPRNRSKLSVALQRIIEHAH